MLLLAFGKGESQQFQLVSATNYALGEATKQAGVHVATLPGDTGQYLLFIAREFLSPLPMAQIVAYPRGSPKSTTEAIPVSREAHKTKVDQP